MNQPTINRPHKASYMGISILAWYASDGKDIIVQVVPRYQESQHRLDRIREVVKAYIRSDYKSIDLDTFLYKVRP